MAEVIHRIDPNPDTVIILEDPSADFAVWDTSDDTLVEDLNEKLKFDDGFVRNNIENQNEGVRARVACRRDRRRVVGDDAGVSAGSDQTRSLFGFGGSNGSIEDQRPSVETTIKREMDEQPSQQQIGDEYKGGSIEYQVSSRHLMLASPWFQRALTREGWTESDRDVDGRYCIRTTGWDSRALSILLNILHLRNRQVPRIISLELLAKIAVLVDYYGCAEAIEPFADFWTNELEKAPVPDMLCRDLILWLWVAWIFQLPEKFEQATFIAIKHSIGDLDALDLPIPVAVTEAIENARIEGMVMVQAGLRALLDEYRTKQYLCPVGTGTSSFECGSMLYGALTKGMDTVGISTEGGSFDGISIEEICTDIRGIRSPTWYHSSSSGYYQSQHMCNLQRPIKAMVDEVKRSLKGLKLEEMKKDI